MLSNPKRSVRFSAGTMPFDLTPGAEKIWLVLNKLNEEFQIVTVDRLRNVDPSRVVKLKSDEVLAYDSVSESYNIMPKTGLSSPDGRFKDVSQTHAMVGFDQRTGLGDPFGKYEPEDGNPQNQETWVKTALRETEEETPFELNGSEIISSVLYKERPREWSPYFNVVFLLNAKGMILHKDRSIRDPLIDPRYSTFYRLDSIPIESPRNPELHPERKDEDELPARNRMYPDIIEQVGTYHACLRRIVGILLQLRQPILAALGRPDAENADDLVAMVLNQYHYRNIFTYRMLNVFAGLDRMDFIVENILKSHGILNKRALVENMVKNIILLTDDDALAEQAMTAIRERLGPGLTGDKSFRWRDMQKNEVHGTFEEFTEYHKFRKSRPYLKRSDREDALSSSEGDDLESAPQSGEYSDEDLWLREMKNVAKLQPV